MDPENVKEFGWALEGEERLTEELKRLDEKLRHMVSVDPSRIFEQSDLPATDKAALAREDFLQMRRDVIFESTRNGVGGWVDDGLAALDPWGFDLATISVPTQVWYAPPMSWFLRSMGSG